MSPMVSAPDGLWKAIPRQNQPLHIACNPRLAQRQSSPPSPRVRAQRKAYPCPCDAVNAGRLGRQLRMISYLSVITIRPCPCHLADVDVIAKVKLVWKVDVEHLEFSVVASSCTHLEDSCNTVFGRKWMNDLHVAGSAKCCTTVGNRARLGNPETRSPELPNSTLGFIKRHECETFI